ncbi:MAG TPA: hypothetical protein PLI39_02125 [Petrotogaceae bacterium]|jgi:hypothetical protein|nr:hypothetical protein [Petrotogaceae bacterium]HPA92691.1 hypothetical protein [Petrotogaceae bacterium]HPX15774.1 hypothetical protein [Petrotogaceae bacterium]HQO12001.1 hypothetical protein [Petrotogaceae bacterium]HQP58621.1 hypothetical protein [Petrotogaceae bacterium]
MKYFSKSPEEWNDYDQKKKNEKERNNLSHRRIKKYTNLLLIAIAVTAILFMIFGNNIGQRLPNLVSFSGINMNLLAEEVYDFPKALSDVKITVTNISKASKKISIDNFSFIIINTATAETVYNFVFPQKIETEFSGISSKVLFNLEKEAEVSSIPNGEYEIRANMTINGKNIVLKKFFRYNHELIMNVYTQEEFYVQGEKPVVKFVLSNMTDSKVTKEFFGDISVKSSDKIILKKQITFGSLNLNPMEILELTYQIQEDIPFGQYMIEFNSPSFEKVYTAGLMVAKEKEKDGSQLQLGVTNMSYYSKGELLFLQVSLENKIKNQRYLQVDQVFIQLKNDEKVIFEYNNDTPQRVFISPMVVKKIFDINDFKEIRLERIGNYEIKISVKIQNTFLNKSIRLQVVE